MDRYKVTLILIVLIAAILRGVALRSSPPSLDWDEAALGYNAYSLLLTGRDEYGTAMPISLRSFDDYKPAVYTYLVVPMIKIWGLNETAVRSVSAVAGVLAVILIYAITVTITRKRVIGLAAALMMAITPWAVHFSRVAFEANLSLLLFLVAILAILRKKYWIALFVSSLNVLTYHSAKIYVPLLVAWIISKNWKDKRIWMGAIVLAGILGISMIFAGGLARLGSARLVDVSVEQIVNRYWSYFSPANLFIRGSNEANQSTPGFATFYVWEALTIGSGVGMLLRSRKKLGVLLLLLIIGPLPAIMTKGWYVPVRVLPLMSMLSIISGMGLVWLWRKNKWLTVGFMGWIVINLCWFAIAEFWLLPYKNYGDWQWGFREVVEKIQPKLDQYDHVVWETGQAQPHIFTLFYLKYTPAKYQQEIGVVPSPRKNFDFGKFEYRKIYWPSDRGAENTLFIGGVYSLPETDLKRDGVDFSDLLDPQGYIWARIAGVKAKTDTKK